MIPTAANSDYPKFVADQVLTSDNLNDLFGYVDEQGRMTRTNLIGIGIVCGLLVKTAANGSSITITKGVGVTSSGYLVSVPEIIYTKRTTAVFDAVKCEYYSKFVDVGTKTQKFDMWELKQEAESEGTTALNQSFLTDGNKIVLLFVELLEENNKNCDPDSCDDKGAKVTVNFRPLLVSKSDVDNFLSNSSNTGTGNAVLLPEFKMRRFDVPATMLLDTEDVLQGYRSILTQSFINGVKTGISNAYTTLQSLLQDDLPPVVFQSQINNRFAALAFLNNGSITLAQAINIQYYYDFFSDLAQAYDELRQKVKATVCACLPDESLFPRHLLLGEAFGFSEEDSLYRTRFISAPVLNCCAADARAVKLLFKKIMLLLENLFIPTNENNENKNGIPIRITPSTLGREPLSEKAIPFYYTVNKPPLPLYRSWSPKRAVDHNEHQVLSYHSEKYNTTDDFVKNPLKYDLEPNNFLRIEGHIGKHYKTVLAQLDSMKKENRLPFEVLALSTDTRGIFNILDSLRTMDSSNRVAGALTEILKHPCCFADLFLALDSWFTRLKCCLADQKKYYMALPSGERQQGVTETHLSLLSERQPSGLNVNTAASRSIGEVYEERLKAGTINSQFCSDIFVNIATEKATPAQGLLIMPYKIDLLYEILPVHISDLNAAEMEKRAEDLTGTAMQMRTLYSDPKVGGTMTGVNLPELQSRLRMNCILCLMLELKTLVREFLLRLLALMIRQKFGFYVYKNPGINHKAGVPMGGTFLLLYHEESEKTGEKVAAVREFVATMEKANTPKAAEMKRTAQPATAFAEPKEKTIGSGIMKSGDQPLLSTILLLEEIKYLKDAGAVNDSPNPVLDPLIKSLADGTVVADFYLPYLCCSDCPPAQMIVLGEKDETNQPPLVEAKAEPEEVFLSETNEAKLFVTAASDPDGEIVSFKWERTFGPDSGVTLIDADKDIALAKFSQADTYLFEVTVTDDKGATGNAEVKVVVHERETEAPKAVARANPPAVKLSSAGEATSELSGEGSTGNIKSFEWKEISEPPIGAVINNPDKKKTSVVFNKTGEYKFRLTVEDDQNRKSTASVGIKVGPATQVSKTCAPLSDVLVKFNALDESMNPNIRAAFEVAYVVYKDIRLFYQRMESGNIPEKDLDTQVSFFKSQKIERLLPKWIEALGNLSTRGRERVVLSSATTLFRNEGMGLLVLTMLDIHALLAYYIACMQKVDVDEADVKMNASLSSLQKVIKLIVALSSSFTSKQKIALRLIETNTVKERALVDGNNEKEVKDAYFKMLNDLIGLF